ncbi:right-handed parallel beta-helix repeat-containing protein [Mucilaginibacter sp. HMF5004]|uniref:chondroitinase-B domain-containing protein n=1 Tax=Mucilaginibacter rivuli TaxID=2857527 RepID=UPI001C5E88D3|nr:chondroitinase-B domain-containing protein [Mucilaginibacter rivuli]MBW4891350.1 right-handed parallel beta-helix repeat-containing protein [Mucilaginibacter rivuli]
MKKILLGTALAAAFIGTALGKNRLVHTQQEFETALTQTQPGDAVVIANGTYTPWELNITISGTAEKPVTIRAEAEGKVTFTGDVYDHIFRITGNYVILNGITFSGCNVLKKGNKNALLIEFFNTKNGRLSKCMFTKNTGKSQFMPLVVISGYGENNRVTNNAFIADVDDMEVQVKVTKEDCPKYTLIDHNTFKDKPKVSWPIYNGGECVQIGQDPILLGNLVPNATVRENVFIHCDGEPEVISNKSTGNKYIKNYFEDCQGELVMRGGHDCLVDSNKFKGGIGGIRVNGTGHTITNNNISNIKTAIRLMYGMAKGKEVTGFYIAASGCTVKYNHITNASVAILVGDSKNVDWTGKFDTNRYPSRTMQDVAPFDNQFVGNVFTGAEKEIVYN